MNLDNISGKPPSVEPYRMRTQQSAAAGDRMAFGHFALLPSARTLLFEGTPVCLGARAFDLLVVLLGSRGRVVSKEDIIRHVWPTTIVDDSNLRFQMTTLRKALGPDRDIIKTIPGRGYLLAAEIEKFDAPISALSMPSYRVQDDQPHEGQAINDALRMLLTAFSRYPGAIAGLNSLLADVSSDRTDA